MTKRLWLLWLLCLYTGFATYAQHSIRVGVFTTGNRPVSGANVTLHLSAGGSIKKFVQTGQQGLATIEFECSGIDTLWVAVGLIGYQAAVQPFLCDRPQPLHFVLLPGTQKLPDVVVRNKPIWQRKDTINYQASAFAQPQDRAVGDIIRRLPGIEVTEGGQIRYQGKPINKYYIEGLDLLEDRYGLANQNLPADAVAGIQVLENHQPIAALDSIDFTNRAALNIKLKPGARRRLLGQGRMAAGLPAPLAEAEVAAMRFAPGTQWLGTYKFSNSGRDFLPELQRQNLADFVEALRSNLVPMQQVQVVQPGNPAFSARRYLRNQQHSFSISGLLPLKKDFLLRTNVMVSTDRQLADAEQQTSLFLPLDTLHISERTTFSRRLVNVEGEAQVLRNHKRLFLKNELRFQGWLACDAGEVRLNEENIAQQARFPFASISNQLQAIVRKSRWIVQGELMMAASRSRQHLQVQPLLYGFLDSTGLAQGWRQIWEGRNFYLAPSVNLRRLHDRGHSSIWLAATLQQRCLTTRLILLPASPEQCNSENDLQYRKLAAEVGLGRQWQWERTNLSLRLPAGVQALRTRQQGSQQTLSNAFFNPQGQWMQQWGSWFTGYHQAGYQWQLPEAEKLLAHPVFTTYRNQTTGTTALAAQKTFTTSHSLEYRRPIKLHFAYLRFQYSRVSNPYLADQHLLMQLLLLQWQLRPNVQHSRGLEAKFSQYISRLKTTFVITGSQQWSRFSLLQKGTETLFTNRQTRMDLEAISKPAGWLSFQTKAQWTLLLLHPPSPAPPTRSSLFQWTLDPVFPLHTQWMLGSRSELAVLRNADRLTYWFADAFVRFTPRRQPWDLELQCQNLGNTQSFGWLRQTASTQVAYSYVLRPRQVLFRGHFKW